MTTIRQREKLVMKKKEDGTGYTGKYYISNMPVDTNTNKPIMDAVTSIVFTTTFTCEMLKGPAKSTKLEIKDAEVEKIASGIDDLELD